MKNKELAKSTAIGAGVGVALTGILRLPVLGMFLDCECPERGAGLVLTAGGIVGGIIGAVKEVIKQNSNPSK